MLYISRYIEKYNYGVYDTDDEVEQAANGQVVLECVNRMGMDIQGVTTTEDAAIRGFRTANEIAPFQHPSFVSPAQTKLHLLSHVEIKTWRNMITNITWDFEKIKAPVVIRLSDFGEICADRILYGNTPVAEHMVTLVVDDSIRFCECALLGPNISVGLDGLGVVFDFTSVKSSSKAFALYRHLLDNAPNYGMEQSIIDTEKRKKYYCG